MNRSKFHPSGVSLLPLALLVFAAMPAVSAEAAVSVKKASLSSGNLLVQGQGAAANAIITASSPESTASGRADNKGSYKITASGYQSSTCTASVSDGSTAVAVTLSQCTPASSTSTVVISPDGPLGPGFVGADFTNNSTLGSGISLGPLFVAVGPARFAIVAGQLPSGLSLRDTNTSLTPAKHIDISVVGVPTTTGTSTFTIRGTDALGRSATSTYTITVNAAQALSINPQLPWAPQVGAFSNLCVAPRVVPSLAHGVVP